jgi:diguanylate cyclase (GGDEF)-like protein
MDVVLRIELNVFSILVVIILALSSRNREERPFLDYRLFMLMLLGTIFELVFDTLMWPFDGNQAPMARPLLMVCTVFYYIGHPFTPMCYALFAVNRVSGNARRIKAAIPFFAIPASLSAALSLVSPFTGWYFFIDGSNVYRHGPLFLLFAAFSYSYFAFSFVFVLVYGRRKENVDRKTFVSLHLFPVFPAIAGVFQLLYYGLVLIWPTIALSLLAIYINIQQSKLSSDYLTGAFNRRRLDEYLRRRLDEYLEARVHDQRGPKCFAGFMADVDDFKRINDKFGHAAGDAALIETVRVLRSSLRSDDFLARYAGDEFVALFSASSEEELAMIVARVRERFASYTPHGAAYRLSLSIGAAIFDPEIDANAEKFIERLDALMYVEKASKKKQRSE